MHACCLREPYTASCLLGDLGVLNVELLWTTINSTPRYLYILASVVYHGLGSTYATTLYTLYKATSRKGHTFHLDHSLYRIATPSKSHPNAERTPQSMT